MAGIGAAVPIIGAIGLVVGLFRKKVTELDAGIRVTTNGMSSLVDTFRTLETRRFFGLSKRVSTGFARASDEVADPIMKAVSGLQQGAIDAAKTLNVTSDAFNGFSYQMQISTRGLSEADAQKAVENALGGLSDAFAGMVPGLQALRKDGEGASATLSRLSLSLGTVNETFKDLGLRLLDVSVAGGGAASAFADLLGGLDGFSQTTQAYYDGFFTEAERTANTTNRLTAAFADLGLALPGTRDAFRGLVEAADAAGNRDLVASLLKLSPAFSTISEAAEDTVSRINQALADLKPEDFATALDFNRARGMLSSGASLADAPAAAQAALVAATGGTALGMTDRHDALLTTMNTNVAMIWRLMQRQDIEGLPPVRT
jgi:hypothetical protein